MTVEGISVRLVCADCGGSEYLESIEIWYEHHHKKLFLDISTYAEWRLDGKPVCPKCQNKRGEGEK
jgi:hypothetical protein